MTRKCATLLGTFLLLLVHGSTKDNAIPRQPFTPSSGPSNSPTRNTYLLDSSDTKPGKEPEVCLLMVARMIVTFEYDTQDNQVNSVVSPVGESAEVSHNQSSCKLSVCAEPTTADLVVEYENLFISLNFDELKGNKHWSYNHTTVRYTVTEQQFPQLKNTELYGSTVEVTSQESLFDWTLTDMLIQSSYRCKANTTFQHFNNSAVGDVIRVSLTVSDLQVQAFRFSNELDQKFDEADDCYADRRIIVPVAVAGALALLMCGVLIFSLSKMCFTKCKERRVKYKRVNVSVNIQY